MLNNLLLPTLTPRPIPDARCFVLIFFLLNCTQFTKAQDIKDLEVPKPLRYLSEIERSAPRPLTPSVPEINVSTFVCWTSNCIVSIHLIRKVNLALIQTAFGGGDGRVVKTQSR